MNERSLLGLSFAEIEKYVADELGQPPFRAKQIYSWVAKGVEPSEMQNIPASVREKLQSDYRTVLLSCVHKEYEKKTDTTKLLLKTDDALLIECVVLVYETGITVCISTQAGCRMGCTFCVSGKDGLFRSLSCEEMVSEVLLAKRISGRDISNIVLMGSGEPLDNYDETIKFIRKITSEDFLNLSPRRITLSTSGIIPGIEKLTKEGLDINLSISTHCAVSEIRKQMMPVEKAYPIKDVIRAAHIYRKVTKRRLTLEYCVVEGTNDSAVCAQALASLTKGSDDLVNLIDVNQGRGDYKKNSPEAVYRFAKLLKNNGVDCTIRRKLGSGINAACGQLRSGYAKDMGGR